MSSNNHFLHFLTLSQVFQLPITDKCRSAFDSYRTLIVHGSMFQYIAEHRPNMHQLAFSKQLSGTMLQLGHVENHCLTAHMQLPSLAQQQTYPNQSAWHCVRYLQHPQTLESLFNLPYPPERKHFAYEICQSIN